MNRDALARGDAFFQRLDDFQRPMFLLAHHDDEITAAGLFQRLAPRLKVVWVTNSDGLYFQSDHTPAEYGNIRKNEGLESASIAGVDSKNIICLDHSEVEIYRRLSQLYSGQYQMLHLRPFFKNIKDQIRQQVLDYKPDLLVTLAWQGGQPEHDLTHFFGKLALRDLAKETGQQTEFVHFPAYEYGVALAMRFHPLYRGQRLRMRLTREEFSTKLSMINAYPSQVELFEKFRKAFNMFLKPMGYLTSGARSMEEFLSEEEFGPVPENLDYRNRPHVLDFFTYMFDDFEGTPVTFEQSIRPIVEAFL